ncbi:MAG: HEAT repeat domain-containing protein, partial [Candidatus Eiseniibacteriota bacterium]
GQMRDEVYNYGSFVQSRMYAHGVTCGDCHDPHSAQLRAVGNALCARCHLASRYDTPAHHHHPDGSAGAECADCHMPTALYMGVDSRHDHSLRIPRPDRTVSLGTPNACNACHADRTARWAADAIRRWTGHDPSGYQNFAESFAAFARGMPGARAELTHIAASSDQPAIVRASALERLAADPTPAPLEAAVHALSDASELVRRAAVGVIANAGSEAVARQLPRMLVDSVRVVRADAARALAALPAASRAALDPAAFDRAIGEWIAVQRYGADRPESHLNIGTLYADQGAWDQAEAEYQHASALAPAAVQPLVQRAELARMRGDEPRAEQILRDALAAHPQAAVLHHALGLTLVREHRSNEALAELALAARLAPEAPRFAYLYGVALHSAGDQAGGIAVLVRASRRFAGDRSILEALATMEQGRGDRERALRYARALAAIAPDDPAALALLRELER